MPKRRDQVAMSKDEMWAFIETQKTVQVATLNHDGWPHLVPLWFAIVDGGIVLESFTKAQKIRNLERDPRISILFEDGDVYEQLKGVSIRAKAVLHQDVETVHHLHMAVLERNTPEIPRDALEKASAAMAPKKTAVVIRPDEGKVMSWDHSKLGGIY